MNHSPLIILRFILVLTLAAFVGCAVAQETEIQNPNGPKLKRVYLVDQDILAVEIIDGVIQKNPTQPYVPQEGDEIVLKGHESWNVENGQIVQSKEERVLSRIEDGLKKEIGWIAGGRNSGLHLWKWESRTGDPLDTSALNSPESFTVSSNEDPLFTSRIHPVAIYQKTKVINQVYPSSDMILKHNLYFKLPYKLQENSTYSLDLSSLNTDKSNVTFLMDSKSIRTEAIHSQQVGYRPDDNFKQAYLSIWLGTGGGYTYEQLNTFQLLNELNEVVFEGPIKLILPEDGSEGLRVEKNYSHTTVYSMDFSNFQNQGIYRVHVPNIGVSYPIKISETGVWDEAFKTSMHGFLAQRSGIELGEPFTTFKRARDFHPEDCVKVYKSTTSIEDAFQNNGKNWFENLIDGRTEETLDGAWGGYHDAGDFDRASSHLWASYQHLELFDLFPDYYETFKLSLPEKEANDTIPDLLNEVLWGIGPFLRTQAPDGGIIGGIESSEHPRKGEYSVTDSLLLMAYKPDPVSTFTYAAVAAKAARLINRYDANQSRILRESAIAAWNWANTRESLGTGYQTAGPRHSRNIAAVELYWLTKDPGFHIVFEATTDADETSILIDQQAGAFTYARLPEELVNEGLKQRCINTLANQAELAIQVAESNAFGLTSEFKDMPLIGPVGAFTVPGMTSRVLTRMHFLTQEDRYLAAALRAAQYALGANPNNVTSTTGIGFESPQNAFHLDSRLTGQEAPSGITVYGAYDRDSLPEYTAGQEWVHTWYIGPKMIPDSRTWPSTEFYIDMFLWPMMTEHTIKQTLGPMSYHLGYLAARKTTITEDSVE